MTYEPIERQLHEIVETIKAGMQSSSSHESNLERALQDGTLRTPIELGIKLLEPLLRSEPKIHVFDGQMRAFVNGWGRVEIGELARSMITRALLTDSATTVSEVHNYLDDESFPVQQILFLGGISVEKSVNITNEIKLVPFRDDLFHSKLIPRHPFSEKGSVSEISTLAIKYSTHPRIHVEHGDATLNPIRPELWDFGSLEDLAYCASLFGPCGPGVIATSICPVNWIPCFGGPIGQCASPTELKSYKTLDEPEALTLGQVYRAFSALPNSAKKRIRVPIRRLNLAMRRRWDVDAAIDLGIALEVLFTDAKPMDSSIGFLLRLRASRLLRASEPDRMSLAKLLSDLYKIRSSAAHTGELPQDTATLKTSETLAQSAAIVAEAVRHFISNGEPDWNSVMFG
jgi:Apea-like HEPN